jgi:hypothetical protein
MAHSGYTLSSEPALQYFWNVPKPGHAGADVRILAGYDRFGLSLGHFS